MLGPDAAARRREVLAAGRAKARKHGGWGTPEYKAWGAMIARCGRQKHREYPNYGGRGISVHAEWRNDFAAFLAYIGPRPSLEHSLDRFPNNDGNYEPGNVRWATPLEQAQNRRSQRGARGPGAKLTEDDVQEIRAVAAFGGQSPAIAAAYGVTKETIRNILRGLTWAER